MAREHEVLIVDFSMMQHESVFASRRNPEGWRSLKKEDLREAVRKLRDRSGVLNIRLYDEGVSARTVSDDQLFSSAGLILRR